MNIIKNQDYSKIVLDNLKKISHPFINGIMELSFKDTDYYIWGGFIRDSLTEYFHGIKSKPNDIDYLVDYDAAKYSGLQFKTKFLDYDWQKELKENEIYRVWFCCQPFDFGSIQFNKAILINPDAPRGLEYNLSCCDLDVCAIAYSPKKDEFYDCGVIDAIKKKEINTLWTLDNKVSSTLSRLILHSEKLDFTLGDKALGYVKENYSPDIDSSIRGYMHYKEKDDLAELVIYKLRTICGQNQLS
jgi:hypothetical protein